MKPLSLSLDICSEYVLLRIMNQKIRNKNRMGIVLFEQIIGGTLMRVISSGFPEIKRYECTVYLLGANKGAVGILSFPTYNCQRSYRGMLQRFEIMNWVLKVVNLMNSHAMYPAFMLEMKSCLNRLQ